MGYFKNRMMAQQEQGWSFTDEYVCGRCVDDYALESAIQASVEAGRECDFCHSSPSAPLDVLLEAFMHGIRNEYGDADNEGVFWDSREGGYQWSTIDTWDLIDSVGDVFVNPQLLDAVKEAVEDKSWVEKDFIWRRRDEVLTESWDQFCYAVMHETRYVFWLKNEGMASDDDGAGEIPPAKILHEIGQLIERLHLLRTIPAGTRFWRGRAHTDAEPVCDANALGTVPAMLALRANRMNPAGIPMFYGSHDEETVRRELSAMYPPSKISLAQFETLQDCTVVDFVNHLPRVPSMFDREWGSLRRQILFLNRFANRLSEPVRPAHEQIDYVPTQIVTEYLLKIFESGTEISGLVFRSPVTGAANVVLDVPNSRCVDDIEGEDSPSSLTLRLVPGTLTTTSPS